MGKLDDEIHGVVSLCPKCHRLNFTRDDPEDHEEFMHVLFKCEQRPYTRELAKQWREKVEEAALSRVVVADVRVPDPGPGLQGDLHVRECPRCSGTRIRQHEYLRFCDLDEMAEAQDAFQPSALTLRGTRR
jgi:phage FluMu protein Com